MAEVTITVRGRHLARVRPQRAIVTLAVVRDGPVRSEVLAAVSNIADALRRLFATLQSAGSATEWSSESVRVASHRPWNNEGVQLDPVVDAAVDFLITFADFDALGQTLDELVAREGVSVHGIEWTLTEDASAAELEVARTRAVTDAAEKAASYARAAGLGDIRPLSIADAGMLDGSPATASQSHGAELMRMASSDAPGLSFAPRDIVVEALVDVRFSAS